MTDNSQASAAAGAGSAGGTPKEVNVSEIDVVQTEAPANPVRKIVLIALGILVIGLSHEFAH